MKNIFMFFLIVFLAVFVGLVILDGTATFSSYFDSSHGIMRAPVQPMAQPAVYVIDAREYQFQHPGQPSLQTHEI